MIEIEDVRERQRTGERGGERERKRKIIIKQK